MSTLAEVLAAHQVGVYGGNVGCSCRQWGVYNSDPHISHVVAAVSAAGLAVIQLPEPSYIDDPEGNGTKGYGFNGTGGVVTTLAEHGVYAYGGKVYDQYDGWTPEQARAIASWWLAGAAAAVEAES